MATEIERKFLVKPGVDFPGLATNVHVIRQGYVARGKLITRIRQLDEKGFITLKGASTGISCGEWEYEIPVEDAIEMLEKFAEAEPIMKTRYRIPYDGKEFEVDVFQGRLSGLVVAEVELTNPDELVSLPDWIVAEVSYDDRFKNSNLIAASDADIADLIAMKGCPV